MSLSLKQIDDGIDLLIENATQLINEAQALLNAQAHPRAFALAHLAREELSRAAMLQAAGLRVLAKQEVPWKELMRRLRDHKSKLRLEVVENALLLKGMGKNTDDIDVLRNGDVKAVTDYRNDQKNVAMYVGFADGKFNLPSNEIGAQKAQRTIILAATRLKQIQFQCQTRPRLSGREIGSLTHLQNVEELVRRMDEETLSSLARLYAEVFGAPFADASSMTAIQGEESEHKCDHSPSEPDGASQN